MVLLASTTDVELALDLEVGSLADDARALFLLDVASGEVIAATGNTFALVIDDEQILDGRGTSVLLLPRIPVVAVTELAELAFSSSPETIFELPTAETPGFEWSADGILRRLDGLVFARRFRAYRVVYSHGLAVVPADVVGIVARIAARTFENPEGLRQETLGRYSYTVAGDQAGVGLFDADRRELEPYMIGPGTRPYTVDNGEEPGS